MVKTPEKPRSEFPPPSKRPRGRPGHQPTPLLRRFVTTLSAHGVPHTDIGLALGISARTLRQHYRAELDRGAAQVHAKLVLGLAELANGSGPVALRATMFALRCRFGWSEYAPVRRK